MAVTDLHSLDVSTPIFKLFDGGEKRGAVLSLIDDTPNINIGDNKPLVLPGRAKGALVHEGGVKPDNGRQVIAKPFTTVKLVYSQRITDEFMLWSRERQQDVVAGFVNDWIRKSLPRDIDTVVFHGLDPHTNTLDTELSDYVMKTGSHIAVPSTGASAAAIDTDFASAVAALGERDQEITGVAIAPTAATKLASVTEGNEKKYPGLGVFGLTGGYIAGMRAASTPEVGANGTELILGDWSKLYLGFAGSADWKTIEYGNPDGGTYDLQNVNQVCIRMELKFGFRVLDPTAFAAVSTGAESES